MSDAVVGLITVALFVVAVVVFGKVVVKGALILIAAVLVGYVIVQLGLWDEIRDTFVGIFGGLREFVETGTGESVG